MIDRHTFTDRVRKPAELKANPIWWFKNDDEQTVDQAPWYNPGWPEWKRRFYWNYLRNPLQNFRCYVIGVQDRNYTVVGRAPVLTVQRDDLMPPETGWQWCLLWITDKIALPFVSYSGKHLVIQLGWQPTGFATAKFNIKKG